MPKKDTTRGIAGIRLHNIGRFEAFNLELRDGEIVELHGDNDEGKSTIPLCITAALFGTLEEKTSASHTSRDGTGQMEVDVSGYTITRIVNAQQETVGLEVVDRNGSRPYEKKAVQAWLDATFHKLKGKQAGCFINPFELMDLPKKEQIAAIVRVLPIDLAFAQDRIQAIAGAAFDGEIVDTEGVFTAIKRLDADFREDRLQLGRKVDSTWAAYVGAAKALPEDFAPDSPQPIKPKPMDELYHKKEEITRKNIRRDELTRKLSANEVEIRQLEERIAGLKNQNTVMQDELQTLGAKRSTDELQTKIDAHEEDMRRYQTALEKHGDLRRRWREKDEYYRQWEEIKSKHGELDGRVKALAALPAVLFARADLPIPGLFIEGEQIMLPDPKDGDLRPAEEFGDAALLDLYIALAMTLAPIPVILADGLERCGPKRSQEIYDRIRAKDFQLIGTRVTPGELRAVSINPDGNSVPKSLAVMVGNQPDLLPVSIAPPTAERLDEIEQELSQELDFDLPDLDEE